MDPFALRRERLAAMLREEALDAYLVSSPVNVRYLTGFTGESSPLIVGRERCVLVSDPRGLAGIVTAEDFLRWATEHMGSSVGSSGADYEADRRMPSHHGASPSTHTPVPAIHMAPAQVRCSK